MDLLDDSLNRVPQADHKIMVVPNDFDDARAPLLGTLPTEGSTVLNGRQMAMLADEISAFEPALEQGSVEVAVWALESIQRGSAGYVLVSGR
ncbi:hypothetical protein GCM10023198_31120 [Promicromonospora umidemergens]|uniref:Uncharacterized protein n=1 Tax=Promicromonospora umidemergens TaxID=629679 RepID=A0ABP8XGX7_9MICO